MNRGDPVSADGARGLIHADGEPLLPLSGGKVEPPEVQNDLILGEGIFGGIGMGRSRESDNGERRQTDLHHHLLCVEQMPLYGGWRLDRG